MDANKTNLKTLTHNRGEENFAGFISLSHSILTYASQGSPKLEFLREVSRMLLKFSRCNAIEIWLRDNGMRYRWCASGDPGETFSFEFVNGDKCEENSGTGSFHGNKNFIEHCYRIICDERERDLSGRFYNPGKSSPGESEDYDFSQAILLPFDISESIRGLLVIKCTGEERFNEDSVEFYGGVAQTLGIAIANRRAQAALKERIKELKCTYGICQTYNIPNLSLRSILRRISNLLPPAMQYPDISSGRIVLDGKSYRSNGFNGSGMKLTSDIVVEDEKRGFIEVVYGDGDPDLGPISFLKEEKHLLDTIAGNISLIIERKEAEEEKAKLTEQLRHADRLATLGELAAGVAHELNEPLGNILGFAQLGKKAEGIPLQLDRDLDKIVSSCLHAREIVKKLLIFARQVPAKKSGVDMNFVVEDVISFFESRFHKEGIRVHLLLHSELPPIRADLSQMRQVLINLVVNSMQAMSGGGSLTITTSGKKNKISLVIEDTGEGMSKKVLKQIFVPFFTTKRVGEGTGLGLPVVHGIVSSHGGTITVDSKPGHGSRFEVLLPITDTE